MKFYGRVEDTANQILEAFQTGNVAKPLAAVFISRDNPQSSWSWTNRFLCALSGCVDARGFRQWKKAGRSVKKGEKASAFIMVPLVKREEGEDGEEEQNLYGFRTVPVFDITQTAGDPIDNEENQFIEELPLVEVARKWEISIGTYDGRSGGGAAGLYSGGRSSIALGVENTSTWLHELVHAADDRLGSLQDRGEHRWRSECVAELGGATLAVILGREEEADLGGAWEYIKFYAEKAEIEPVTACTRVLERTCKAISLILEEAGNIVS